MTLITELKDQMKQSMIAKDKLRLGTIRMALAAIKQIEVDTRETLNEQQIIGVLTKMVKQRRDAIEQFITANRTDLADAEAAEIKVLEFFLPQPLSEDEVKELVEESIQSLSASSMADMGKVMAALKPKLQGRADMGAVSALIRSRLQ